MTDPRRPGADPMEAALADLAAAIEWPATPPLAASVGAAIRTGTPRAPGWRPARRALVLGVLAALLIAGLAAAVGIALGGLRILGSGEPPGSPLAPGAGGRARPGRARDAGPGDRRAGRAAGAGRSRARAAGPRLLRRPDRCRGTGVDGSAWPARRPRVRAGHRGHPVPRRYRSADLREAAATRARWSSRWWWARPPATGSRAASTSSTSATRTGTWSTPPSGWWAPP